MSYRYPVFLDVRDRLSVIVGGGAVAARKASGLLQAGSTRVRVVAPAFHPDMPAAVERMPEAYREDHLQGAQLVFAATDSAEVNDLVVRDARKLGLLVNRADADDELAGDFTLPAQLQQGPLLVAVSAAGSPALAAGIRDRLRDLLDPAWTRLAEASLALRPRIKRSARLDPGRRRSLLKDLAGPEALSIVKQGGDVESLWQWAVARYPELQEE